MWPISKLSCNWKHFKLEFEILSFRANDEPLAIGSLDLNVTDSCNGCAKRGRQNAPDSCVGAPQGLDDRVQDIQGVPMHIETWGNLGDKFAA